LNVPHFSLYIHASIACFSGLAALTFRHIFLFLNVDLILFNDRSVEIAHNKTGVGIAFHTVGSRTRLPTWFPFLMDSDKNPHHFKHVLFVFLFLGSLLCYRLVGFTSLTAAIRRRDADPILGLLQKYDKEREEKTTKRLNAGCSHHLDVFKPTFTRQIQATQQFLNDHKIPFVYSDGSALAIERFDMLSSPWDDDIDMCMMLDEGVSIFTMSNDKLHPAYLDVSKSRKAQQVFENYCLHESHKHACVGFRMVLLIGTDDCISFEALSWGFAQIRYHVGCGKSGIKVMDGWFDFECRDDKSKPCLQAKKNFKSYINQMRTLPAGKRTSNGLKKEGMVMTRGETHLVTLRNGLKVPVLVKNKEYLTTIYGKSYRDSVIVCPHTEYAHLGSCLQDNDYVSMHDVLSTMAKVPACEEAMRRRRV
jgi:hypothetical protein